jgi:D-beta-D-heptose 7-phosphate kinase/D-beta-D-heptose 1-phosphate adenosyltransferase
MNTQTKKIVVASGYFNPIHVGHIEYLERAKELGDKLVVIVNTDAQVKIKGSVPFQTEQDRLRIVQSLKVVDQAILSIDTDGSVCRSLVFLKPDIFAKGGDRHSGEIPEKVVCDANGIAIIDGLGAKFRSSSGIISAAIV